MEVYNLFICQNVSIFRFLLQVLVQMFIELYYNYVLYKKSQNEKAFEILFVYNMIKVNNWIVKIINYWKPLYFNNI